MFFFFLQETKCPKIVSDFWAHFLRCVLSPHQFPAHRFSHKIKTDDLHHNRDDPRCRIRNKQEVQRFVMWEKSKNPENSRSDRTDHRQDHRHCRMSHPPKDFRLFLTGCRFGRPAATGVFFIFPGMPRFHSTYFTDNHQGTAQKTNPVNHLIQETEPFCGTINTRS